MKSSMRGGELRRVEIVGAMTMGTESRTMALTPRGVSVRTRWARSKRQTWAAASLPKRWMRVSWLCWKEGFFSRSPVSSARADSMCWGDVREWWSNRTFADG